MKKAIRMLLLLILALSVCCASAQENDARIAEHSVAAIQQRGTLLVAIQASNSKMSYWGHGSVSRSERFEHDTFQSRNVQNGVVKGQGREDGGKMGA